MIKAVNNTISFGDSSFKEIRQKIHQAEITKDNMVEGALGTGGAVAVANGNKIIKATSGAFGTASKTGSNVVKNTKTFQEFLQTTLKSAEKVKFLKPFAKFAQFKPVRLVSGAIGGLAAIGLAAGDMVNMVNVGAKLHDNGFAVFDKMA